MMPHDLHKYKLYVSAETALKITPKFKTYLDSLVVSVCVVMSDTAYNQLSDEQKELINRFERVNMPDIKKVREIHDYELINTQLDMKEILMNVRQLEMQKERNRRKNFYVPKTIGKVCSKKKGGR